MVFGSSLLTVQDYRFQMADFIPVSRDFQKNNPKDKLERFSGITTYQTGLCDQENLDQGHVSERQGLASNKRRPYVVRCSSLRMTTTPNGNLSPSLPLSSESQKPHPARQFAQYHNGYHQEQLPSNNDAAHTQGHLPNSYGISPDPSSRPTHSPPYSDPCSKLSGEHNGSRSVQFVSQNHQIANTNIDDHSSKREHQRSKTFIPGDLFPNNEASKNMRLVTSNFLEYSSSSDISFNAVSPVTANTSYFDDVVANTSEFTSRRSSSKTSEQFNECSGNFSSKNTTDFIQCYTNLHNKNQVSSQKLTSQSYSDMSRTQIRQPFQLSKSSSGDFTSQSMDSQHKNCFYFAGPSTALPSASNCYSSLPRRCSSDHFLRRTLSHEPRIQEIKPKPAGTASQNEIESEYVTLDKRYVPPKFTRLSGVTEGVACFNNPQFNLWTPPSARGDHFQYDHLHSRAAQKTCINTNTGITAANTGKPNESINTYNGIAPTNTDRPNESINTYNGISPTNTDRPNESALKSNSRSDSRKETSTYKSTTGSIRTMAETIGSLFSYKGFSNSLRGSASPRSGDSLTDTSTNAKNTSGMRVRRRSSEDLHENSRPLSRSRSLSDLQTDASGGDESSRNYSDDEDGDEFGFLSYPISFMPSCTSAAMNKAKSPSPGNRIFTKRWRNKSNVTAGATSVAMWTPGTKGSYTWSSVSGRKVQLRPVSILSLTEAEREGLQKVALLKIQNMDIGCTISLPKDAGELTRAKKSPLSLKRRSKSVSASALDTMVKDGTSLGLAFGIPLLRCILNDRELDKRTSAVCPGEPLSCTKLRTHSSDNFLVFRSGSKSSSSSQSSADNGGCTTPQRLESLTVPSSKRTASSDSLSESESSHNTNSSLIDALSLSTSNPASSRSSSLAIDGGQQVSSSEAQVPYVVRSCFKHIETYGLQTLGIFRVGCSKKRVKQLRKEFDCGREVKLSDEHNQHDVAALLKEFFRDLPEPLLTRELYLPFLHAERIKDEQKRHTAISLLISMLPVPNRDTLWALLRFLAVVSHHAPDTINERGAIVAGNKMDSHNLATLFGPNILHRTKVASDKEFISESMERVEQSKEVIEVVKDMIDNYHELFQIPPSLRDDVLKLLVESNQEAVNRILRHLANQNQIETDPESMSSVFEDPCNSPVLYHSTNSDVDLTVLARKQTGTSHRPLRVTKSADDSLDSPDPDLLDPHFPEYRTQPSETRDNLKTLSSNTTPVLPKKLDSGPNYPSPVLNRIPVLKMSYEHTNPEVVLRNRLEAVSFERPYSEGFNRNLNIPRQFYQRQNSSSSISSGLPSPLITYGGSDNGQCEHWILSTPPISRDSSPKQLYRCSSSSSTLLTTSTTSNFNNSESGCENSIPIGSAEWERARWKHWEKIAAQKKTVEAEQETLV